MYVLLSNLAQYFTSVYSTYGETERRAKRKSERERERELFHFSSREEKASNENVREGKPLTLESRHIFLICFRCIYPDLIPRNERILQALSITADSKSPQYVICQRTTRPYSLPLCRFKDRFVTIKYLRVASQYLIDRF